MQTLKQKLIERVGVLQGYIYDAEEEIDYERHYNYNFEDMSEAVGAVKAHLNELVFIHEAMR